MVSGVDSSDWSKTVSTGGDIKIRGELEHATRRLVTALDRTDEDLSQKVSMYLTANDTTVSFFLRPRFAFRNISWNGSKSQCLTKHAKSWISLARRVSGSSLYFHIIFMVEMTALTNLVKSSLILHSCHRLGTASCNSFFVIFVSLANKNSWTGSMNCGRNEEMRGKTDLSILRPYWYDFVVMLLLSVKNGCNAMSWSWPTNWGLLVLHTERSNNGPSLEEESSPTISRSVSMRKSTEFSCRTYPSRKVCNASWVL